LPRVMLGESLPECVHVSMKFRVLVASLIICERNCRPLLVVAPGEDPHQVSIVILLWKIYRQPYDDGSRH
jgi:hypothetical protein